MIQTPRGRIVMLFISAISPFGAQSADPSGNAMPPSGTDLALAMLRAQTRSLMSPSGDIGRHLMVPTILSGLVTLVSPSGYECHTALASLRWTSQILEASLLRAQTSQSFEANPVGDSLWGSTS